MSSIWLYDHLQALPLPYPIEANIKCPPGHFFAASDEACQPHLGCNDLLEDVQVYDDVLLNFLPSRIVKLASWKQKKLVKHHSLNNFNMEPEFRQHLALFKMVLSHQLIGYCDAPGHVVFITEYFQHSSPKWTVFPSELQQRLQLCSSYAELLVFLHDKHIVLDFDDEKDFLDDVIIGQDPWRLILDEVFFLKASNSSGDSLDIWMTPEVCNSFLSKDKDRLVKVYLSQIHKQCRDKDPEKRPTASQLLKAYRDVLQMLQFDSHMDNNRI